MGEANFEGMAGQPHLSETQLPVELLKVPRCDVLVVLGKSWRDINVAPGEKPKLSVESKMNALAGGGVVEVGGC